MLLNLILYLMHNTLQRKLKSRLRITFNCKSHTIVELLCHEIATPLRPVAFQWFVAAPLFASLPDGLDLGIVDSLSSVFSATAVTDTMIGWGGVVWWVKRPGFLFVLGDRGWWMNGEVAGLFFSLGDSRWWPDIVNEFYAL